MDGLLVIDKPVGPTSHDVVAQMRRTLGERRIGHTGTLDPAASGVLPLVVGRATRLARFLSAADKSYEAVVRLGQRTDTCDAAGAPVGPRYEGPLPDRPAIAEALASFRGPLLQQPPAFSAKRIDGRRSYRLARDARAAGGTEPSPLPAPAAVSVHALDLLDVEGGDVRLRIDCSAGFYVRTLAVDLGEALCTGAHLAALRRTRSGDLVLAGAIPLDAARASRGAALEALVPLAGMLKSLAGVELTDEGLRRVGHGRDIGPDDVARLVPGAGAGAPAAAGPSWVRLLSPAGELVGVAQASGDPALLHPSVVLM